MSNKEVKPISVQQLLLDLQNPRYDVLNNQIEVIAEILDDQGRKLVKLAADIAEAGLNPSELPMVAQHEQDKNKIYSSRRKPASRDSQVIT